MTPVTSNQSDAVIRIERHGGDGKTWLRLVSLFFYGDYRYTKLAHAVAEAKRNPRAD